MSVQDLQQQATIFHQALTNLNQVILDEFNALSDRDTKRITELSHSKLELTQHIEQLKHDFEEIVKRTGITRFSDWLDANPGNQVTNTWHEIESLITQCATQNQLNGMIVENNRRNVETLLGILRGQTVSGESYTRSGTMACNNNTATIGQV